MNPHARHGMIRIQGGSGWPLPAVTPKSAHAQALSLPSQSPHALASGSVKQGQSGRSPFFGLALAFMAVAWA